MGKKNLFELLLIAVPLIVIGVLTPIAVKQHNISSLQNKITELKKSIEIYSGNIEELQAKHNACSTKQAERHNQANSYRTEIEVTKGQIQGVERQLKELVGIEEEYVFNEDIMNKVCELAPKSPLCGDNKLLSEIQKLPNYKLLLGISYAESHLGSNYAPHFGCKYSNNRGGVKRAKFDSGKVSVKYTEQYKTLDKELQGHLSGCYLYAFDTPIDYFKSLSNTIEQGYGVCNGDPSCIVKSYVGKYSQSWVDNVNKFISS